ncbi:MAG: hypothetical protein JETT_0795 [Candidatus Jettenia ecosi]|uniref:Uncharacterized protein n=1 Tax=Candidatus Jettenia ecosi TaxID=2494326 RepID=A0A533QDR8_9BACT|nr:MAG: hypothetical protein JETT_0795 [Candidatus Jettenia ecosi]
MDDAFNSYALSLSEIFTVKNFLANTLLNNSSIMQLEK